MKRAFASVAFAIVLAGLLAAHGRQAVPATAIAIDRAALLRDLDVLAADDMAGRRTGTPGHERARRYIERRFREAGLEPFGEAGGFAQPFTFTRQHRPESQKGTNLVGVLRGTERDDLAFVVTAHYDHLGVRDGKIFNGADDNASGTAGLIALAAAFKGAPLRHRVIFAALDAEEMGLQGAKAFLATSRVAPERLILNVNLDMIGRDEKNTLYVAGTSHYPFLRPYVERAAAGAPIKLVAGHDGPGAPLVQDWTRDSDHFAFHQRGIPFLYFGVENVAHHHKPTDTASTITREFYMGAVETIAAVLRDLDRAPPRRGSDR